MRTIIEELDGVFYIEAILSPQELSRIDNNEMIEGEEIFKGRKYYINIRLPTEWDYGDENEPEGE